MTAIRRWKKKTALVFGTFDRLHDGHRFFLRESGKRGDTLIAVVARDSIVRELKGHNPLQTLAERIRVIHDEKLADAAVPGDEKIGTWNTIRAHRPDVVCVGYDQDTLRERLDEYARRYPGTIRIVSIPPFRPERFHSSLLKNSHGNK